MPLLEGLFAILETDVVLDLPLFLLSLLPVLLSFFIVEKVAMNRITYVQGSPSLV